jgi:hypothetical protein
MMSATTAPRHGARCLGPVMPIVMAEMITEAGGRRLDELPRVRLSVFGQPSHLTPSTLVGGCTGPGHSSTDETFAPLAAVLAAPLLFAAA